MLNASKINYRIHELHVLKLTNTKNEVSEFIEMCIEKNIDLPPVIMTYNKDNSGTIISGESIVNTVMNSTKIKVKRHSIEFIEFNNYVDDYDEEFFKKYLEIYND